VFRDLGSEEDVDSELTRLIADGLIDGVIEFGAGGALSEFGINGLTEEGREFYKLVENYDVWRLVRETLDAARVDVSVAHKQRYHTFVNSIDIADHRARCHSQPQYYCGCWWMRYPVRTWSFCRGVAIYYPLQTNGGVQQVRFITEGDVYRLSCP